MRMVESEARNKPTLSHSAPSLPIFPFEFWGEVNHEETRVIGLSYREDRMIVA